MSTSGWPLLAQHRRVGPRELGNFRRARPFISQPYLGDNIHGTQSIFYGVSDQTTHSHSLFWGLHMFAFGIAPRCGDTQRSVAQGNQPRSRNWTGSSGSQSTRCSRLRRGRVLCTRLLVSFSVSLSVPLYPNASCHVFYRLWLNPVFSILCRIWQKIIESE